MEYVNFPIVALGAALICLIGITLYAITQRGASRMGSGSTGMMARRK